MRIVYRKTIIDKLMEKIYEARHLNKEIDYVLLSRTEYVEFRKHPFSWCHSPLGNPPCDKLTMRTVELRNPDRYGPQYVRFAPAAEFNGVDLYVVPDEFL